MNKYVSIKKAKEVLGVSNGTLKNWAEQGKIDFIKSPSGRRLYNIKDVCIDNNILVPNEKKKQIAYCRVSSKKQMDDLERQKSFFRQQYPDYKVVTDIGSGLNWKRKGFRALLESAMQGEIQEVMVAHRDRLCRFSFELVQFILEKSGVKLVVLNERTSESGEEELCDDILSIVHVYSCRQMGRRRYTLPKDQVLPE